MAMKFFHSGCESQLKTFHYAVAHTWKKY